MKEKPRRRETVVLKIGTRSIVTPDGCIREELLDRIAEDVFLLQQFDYHTIIVSSGAIACGKMLTNKLLSKQAYAGIGQPHLMASWEKAFAKVNLLTAQGLYVNSDLCKKESCKSATKTLGEYRRAGIVPILNENDMVTDAEVRDLFGFGDNDQLASLIARAQEAKFLFSLTTVDGVICPKKNTVIPLLSSRERVVESSLQSWKGDSHGGMTSKVHSAKAFVRSVKGSRAFIASYREEDILRRVIIERERIGTEIY